MAFDFGIIGIGAAGSHVLHALLDDQELKGKSVLVIEKEQKVKNDRTWSFWELSSGYWDKIVSHSWEKGKFITGSTEIILDLQPYVYKSIRSEDFYAFTADRIKKSENVTLVRAEVKSVGDVNGKPVILLENGDQLAVDYLFDSRVTKKFYVQDTAYYKVWQHFKGWVIKTADPVFDPDRFVMMDYRLRFGATTSFMYILPYSNDRALLEYTFFSPQIQEESVYDEFISKYLQQVLKTDRYVVEETEKGVIPMTDFPFHRSNKERHIRIGTAGSWVKGSSGYSFKNAERKARMIAGNLKAGRNPASGLLNQRHRFYDAIFLDLLYRHNHLGEELFTSMYSENEIQAIFRFLDEETTIKEELDIISTFRPAPFLGALGRNIARRFFVIK